MGLYDYVMSNPYGSTSNNFFYKNSQTGEDFSILNKFQPIAGRDEVWNFQRQELASLQKNVSKGVHQKLNDFILGGNLNSGPSEYMAQQNQTIENATAKIWENIQALRDNGKDWEEKWKRGINITQERNRLLAQLRDAMIDVKKKANINSPIYEEESGVYRYRDITVVYENNVNKIRLYEKLKSISRRIIRRNWYSLV